MSFQTSRELWAVDKDGSFLVSQHLWSNVPQLSDNDVRLLNLDEAEIHNDNDAPIVV